MFVDGVSDAEHSVGEDCSSPEKEEKAVASDEVPPEQNITTMNEEELKEEPDSPHSDESSHEMTDDSQISLKESESTDVEPSETEEQPSETQEPVIEPAVEPEVPVPDEFPHTCATCRKTFRHAATLSRHQSIHQTDGQVENGGRRTRQQQQPGVSGEPGPSASAKTSEQKEEEPETEAAEKNGDAVESEVEEEDRNDEEDDGGSSEAKGAEEVKESVRGRSEKRKKMCNVCGKRFWSLQDLTRHIRSHTGKSSLVRLHYLVDSMRTCDFTQRFGHLMTCDRDFTGPGRLTSSGHNQVDL